MAPLIYSVKWNSKINDNETQILGRPGMDVPDSGPAHTPPWPIAAMAKPLQW
ncbi:MULTISPECIES: hypothetical protein [Mesorhizobium]|uniref:hypothetical protein n=1 Tax=Mesorhizobium TaxID=68287 RepID=UPI000A482D31|nr:MULTISPECIES: hypothetical protein [Mesorhizobium]MDF3211176.1 hypothetical protein [Mesorhizobium sp. LMG15046]MDF3232751.1 hypothetical protein [Mesorhizobium sp. DSM 30133]